MTLPADISCSALEAADCAAAAALLTEAFCHGDPIEAALRIAPDEFRVMADLELAAAWSGGLSMVARCRGADAPVGVLVATDMLAEAVDGKGRISEKFAPIGAVARDFHHRYLALRDVAPGACLYLFMLGVRPDMAGRGIGTWLTGEVLRNARNKGYASAAVMTTNLASARALERHGFVALDTLSYQAYRYEGRPVFASIVDHPGIALMELPSLADL